MVLKASMRIVPVHEGSRRTTVLHSAIEKPAIPRKAFSVMDRTACAILQSEGVIGMCVGNGDCAGRNLSNFAESIFAAAYHDPNAPIFHQQYAMLPMQRAAAAGSPGSENGQTRRYAFIRVAALARKP